jgi:hypothetical protein
MRDDAAGRETLAQRQAELVLTLKGERTASLTGFEEKGLAATRSVLARKAARKAGQKQPPRWLAWLRGRR